MRLVVRVADDPGVAVEVHPARPLPLDWYRWRDALLGGTPAVAPVEGFTAPHGWSLTVVDAAPGVHGFYAVLDNAIHVVATLPADADAAVRARLHAALVAATVAWDDGAGDSPIVALGQL